MSTFEDNVKEMTALVDTTIAELKNLDDLKTERGIIEDFFKVAKDAFGLGKFHSYTEKSMVKNILLGFLLTTMVVQCGFKTKTQLQRLSEGYVDLQPPKIDKKKQKEEKNKNTEEKSETEIKESQQTLNMKIKEQITNLFNYSDRKSLKSKISKEDNSKDSKKLNEKVKFYLTEKLKLTVPNISPWNICN